MPVAATAVVVELSNESGRQKRYTISNSAAVSKGFLLQLSTPRTAAVAENPGNTPSGANGVCVGISSHDKEANDGSTSISIWTDGIFRFRASGAITVGQLVIAAGNNEVRVAQSVHQASSYALIVGRAEETITDGSTGAIRVRL